MNRKILVVAIAAALIGAAPSSPPVGRIRDTTFSNFDKSYWNITDTPSVGTVLRIRYKGNKIRSVIKFSDALVPAFSEELLETVEDSNQISSGKGGKNLDVTLGLLQIIGINIAGDFKKSYTYSISFKGVQVRQYKDFQSFRGVLRHLDSPQSRPTPEQAEILAELSQQSISKIRQPERSAYWIVTKVFTAESVDWTFESDRGGKFKASCSSTPENCGSITAESGSVVSGTASGQKRRLFVVVKPLYTDEKGLIRIGEIDPKAAPSAISG